MVGELVERRVGHRGELNPETYKRIKFSHENETFIRMEKKIIKNKLVHCNKINFAII